MNRNLELAKKAAERMRTTKYPKRTGNTVLKNLVLFLSACGQKEQASDK